jgi:pimeloyl-ACP methyl ester carboxylesterase
MTHVTYRSYRTYRTYALIDRFTDPGCSCAFSETDLTEDLKEIAVPTLVLHGDDDQIVPIADSALLFGKIVKHATLNRSAT